jgi:hypothetical protein
VAVNRKVDRWVLKMVLLNLTVILSACVVLTLVFLWVGVPQPIPALVCGITAVLINRSVDAVVRARMNHEE